MSLYDSKTCPKCSVNLTKTHVIGVEYDYTSVAHYDGVSEWVCLSCGYREGRWSGKELKGKDVELPFGKITNKKGY